MLLVILLVIIHSLDCSNSNSRFVYDNKCSYSLIAWTTLMNCTNLNKILQNYGSGLCWLPAGTYLFPLPKVGGFCYPKCPVSLRQNNLKQRCPQQLQIYPYRQQTFDSDIVRENLVLHQLLSLLFTSIAPSVVVILLALLVSSPLNQWFKIRGAWIKLIAAMETCSIIDTNETLFTIANLYI